MKAQTGIVKAVGVALFVELCLQVVSLSRYVYAKIKVNQELAQINEHIWVNTDPRYRWWFEESAKIVNAYEPYVNWKTADMATPHISVQQGVRKTVGNPASGGESATKLFVFCGSTMWGYLAKDEETIPSVLATALNAAGSWNITNHAEIGYVQSQELVRLMGLLRRGNIPDVVVFYDGCNDVRMNTPYGNNKVRAFEEAISQRLGNLDDYSKEKPLVNQSLFSLESFRAVRDFVFTYIKIVRYPVQAYRSIVLRGSKPADGAKNAMAPTLSDYAKRLASEYLENARIIDSLSHAYGFRYVLVWQPIITDKKPLTDEERRVVDYYELTAETEPVWNQAKAIIRQSDIPNFYDLSDAFASLDKTVFFDRCHITAEGNRIIAKSIQEILER